MEFDFLFKLIITCCFLAVTIVVCCKWIVETYLDYIQVVTGIKVVTLEAAKEQHRLEQKMIEENDDDPTAY